MAATIPPSIGSIDDLNNILGTLGINEKLPTFAAANPVINPVDVYRSYIAEELAKITGLDRNKVYESIEWTQDFKKGDLIVAVPRLRVPGKPQELAQKWADQFPENEYVQKPTVQATFLQFWFKPAVLSQLTIPSILSRGAKFGANKSGNGKKVVVEFSSPNIAKPFHAGHLRSTIIGGFLSNLFELCDWEVVRINYLGDWGKQFGLLAVGYEKWGNEEKLQADAIQHLFEVYVKINKAAKEEEAAIAAGTAAIGPEGSIHDQARSYFKKMEDGDKDALALWKRFRDLSIVKCEKTYARLNIHYDDYSGESTVKNETMDTATKILEEKKIVVNSEGAKIIDFTALGAKKLGKAIVQKKDGTSLYLTRDIGAAMERWEKYKFDKMIYVVASQQDLHLAQLFKILELMGCDWAKRCEHINFGMVLGMSTRNGDVVFLDSILDDVGDAMHEVMKKNEEKYRQVENPAEIADIVGKSSVMIQDYSGKRINNYPFSLERMTSYEGDTGPYLQYAHARLCSILRKANIPMPLIHSANLSLLTESHAQNLLRCLAQYPDVITNTLKNQEASTIVTYLFKMTHLLSSSYDLLRIVGEEENLSRARMALYESARTVLNNGMCLLGITPVERM